MAHGPDSRNRDRSQAWPREGPDRHMGVGEALQRSRQQETRRGTAVAPPRRAKTHVSVVRTTSYSGSMTRAREMRPG